MIGKSELISLVGTWAQILQTRRISGKEFSPTPICRYILIFQAFGSLWNHLAELNLPMLSVSDLGVIVGHRVFYK